MKTEPLAWSGEIACEGGPVLIANLSDFEQWRGSEPQGAEVRVDSDGDQGLQQYGRDASGFLWSIAPGLVHVFVDEHRNHILLVQVGFADDEEDEDAALAYAFTAGWQQADAGNEYRITDGPVVVTWSANSVGDLGAPLRSADVAPYLPGRLLDLSIDASGALVWLTPGWYQSSLHHHEEGCWAVSWCRLQRMSP